MIASKRSTIIMLLLISQQFWTIKIGMASMPMIGMLVATLLSYEQISKVHPLTFIVILYLAISAIYNAQQWDAEFIQYTPYFSLLALSFWIFSHITLREIQDIKDERAFFRFAIYCAILGFMNAAIISPYSIITPQDGEMGFFNEKGLFGYYVSILSCVLYIYSSSNFRWIILAVFLGYTGFIIESSRSFLVYASLFALYLDSVGWRKLVYIFLAVLFSVTCAYLFGVLDNVIAKLEIIQDNAGTIGRYAATQTITHLDLNSILFGTGFGTYLSTRSLYVEVLPELPYDYAGSFLMEMIVELGIVQTVILYLGITKILYNRVSLPLLGTIIMLTLTGGKQDLQMIFGLILFSIFYRSIQQKNNTTRYNEIL